MASALLPPAKPVPPVCSPGLAADSRAGFAVRILLLAELPMLNRYSLDVTFPRLLPLGLLTVGFAVSFPFNFNALGSDWAKGGLD